jgi:hypothetical protein
VARLAKKLGMRGIVMKNHSEDTAGLVYMVRKEVPGIELFGGITEDVRINLDDVSHMTVARDSAEHLFHRLLRPRRAMS